MIPMYAGLQAMCLGTITPIKAAKTRRTVSRADRKKWVDRFIKETAETGISTFAFERKYELSEKCLYNWKYKMYGKADEE